MDYVGARLGRPHIEASAAIPFLFPPVRVDAPAVAAGWYFDGGTRLSTPIKPALEPGARACPDHLDRRCGATPAASGRR